MNDHEIIRRQRISGQFAAYRTSSGPNAAIAVGAIVSVIVLLAGQIAFRTFRSTPVGATIALLFAVPAAVAAIMLRMGSPVSSYPLEVGEKTIAIAGAIMVATIAWARITLSARTTRAGHCRSRETAHLFDGAQVERCSFRPTALTYFATGRGARSLVGGTAHAVDQPNGILRWHVVAPANVSVRPY